MSDLEQLQKNLNYKIKAQEIGLASWKGSHGAPQKMFIPNKDYLLNSASKQQDMIKKRNEMVEEYLEEQETPIYRYDEFGNIMVDGEGKPIEYKFHGAPPPELDLSPLKINIYDPITRRMVDEDLTIDDQKRILKDKDDYIYQTTRHIEENIRQYREDLENHKREIIAIDTAVQDLKKKNDDLYAIPNLANRKKLAKKNTVAISYLLRDKQTLARQIEDIKTIINNAMMEQKQYKEDIEDIASQVKDKLKENEEKIKSYNEQLNALNSGQLSTSKAFDETDEQYAQRLQRMADVPFADRRAEEKAFIRMKEKLRENLKTIVRSDSVISQVVNYLFNNKPEELGEINKLFKGFADYFIKKYGENNEKIKFKDINDELTFYLQKSRDPRVLTGNVTNPEEIAAAVAKNISSSLIPFERGAPAPTLNIPGAFDMPEDWEEVIFGVPPGGVGDVPSESFLTGAEESGLSEEEGEVSEDEPENKLKIRLIKNMGVNDTMELTNSKGKSLFIKWYTENVKIKKKEGKLLQDKEFISPIFFISDTGKPNSYSDISYKQLVDKISTFFGVTKSEVYKLMGIRDKKSFKKEDLSTFLGMRGLLPTLSAPPKIIKTGPLVIGYGIKQAQDLPDKVPFGSNILFLKKLFLKNILSIQNKHNTKINGFNNVHVSDNFVKIIMNLLKGVNFTNSELQNLTNNEKLLLDNLLILSELNKKFVTGSSTSSLNQLKKDYEILIGEIEAGNNNDLLKKKLYNLLMRMVHFGALSQIQAHKHYKEILKSHF